MHTLFSSLSLMVVFHPGLGAHLHWVPGTTHGRGVAEIEGIQIIDEHVVKQGSSKNINPFGDFALPVASDLRSQEATRLLVPCDPEAHFLSTRVVYFVVPERRLDRERIEASTPGLIIAQPCSGNHHVKHFDHLASDQASAMTATVANLSCGLIAD